MSKRLVLVPGLLLALACGSQSRPVGPASTTASSKGSAASTPRILSADTPSKTASGVSFEAPKGWSLQDTETGFVLRSPENDLSVTLVELAKRPDAETAIAEAWRTLGAKSRAVQQVNRIPARDGWDEIVQIAYEVPTQEHRTVMALAQRKGDVRYVLLLDGTEAALDRRGAQVGTVFSTFKAPGVEEESFAGKSAHELDPTRLARLDAFVKKALANTHIPGAAVAIVQHGKIVSEQGYGVTDAQAKGKVGADTLFMIGSTTKSLTTLMMADLVDDEKLRWDAPLTSVLPSFQLADPAVTQRVLMRHTVCACTGMPRRDLDLFFGVQKATPESRLALLKTMTPSTDFGEIFQYSNLMVAAGGYAAAHAAFPNEKLGPAYDRVMRERVFAPLGMQNTTLDFARVEKAPHAMPHGLDFDDHYRTLPLSAETGVVAVRPAGGVWSSAHDMTRYLLLELSKGKNERGERVVSEAGMLRRRAPQMKITDKSAYGYGLFIEHEHGVLVVGHGGNNLGFTSDLFFLPEHDVGLVVLLNGDAYANTIRSQLRRKLFEVLFDGKDVADERLDAALARSREGLTKERSKLVDADPGWTRGLVGSYTNADLGTLVVSPQGKALRVDAGDWKSTAGARKDDDGTLQLVLLEPPFGGLPFVPSKDGKSLTVAMPQQKYVFEKR